jgi:DNA polymerase III subunit gamma/tau
MTDQKIREIIVNVSSKEGCSLDEESVDILVKIANGSARDALSALEQVIVLSPNITSDSLTEIFGYYSDTKVENIYKEITSNKEDLSSFINNLHHSTNFFKLAEDIIRIANAKDFKLVNNIITHFSILKDNQYSKEIFLAIINMSFDVNKEYDYQNYEKEKELKNNKKDLDSIHVDSKNFVAKLISDEKYDSYSKIDSESNKLQASKKITEKLPETNIEKNNLDSEIINIMLLNQENIRTDLKKVKDDFIINNGVNSKTDELLRKSKII